VLSHRQAVAAAFGRTLRDARLRVGMSQERLAERANLDRTYPSLLERGLRTPTLTAYLDISAALDLEPEALVQETLLLLHPKLAKTCPPALIGAPTPVAPIAAVRGGD
jgi:transcriptional regulator with XRE-family HTH domain